MWGKSNSTGDSNQLGKGTNLEGSSPFLKILHKERGFQERGSFRSSAACLFAFFASALASALGAIPWIALPRLTAPLPVTFALRESKTPGMSRFLATCAAATHCPRFLNPLHAVCASWPVSVWIFPAMAVLWLKTVLGEACDMSLCAAPPLACDPLIPDSLPGPRPAGGPPG